MLPLLRFFAMHFGFFFLNLVAWRICSIFVEITKVIVYANWNFGAGRFKYIG